MTKKIWIALLFLLGLLYFIWPAKSGKILIKPDTSSAVIARNLKDQGIIRSKLAFLFLTRLTNTSQKLKSGYYLFSGDSLLNVWWKIYRGNVSTLKIPIPEGLTSQEIAHRLNQYNLKNFDSGTFLNLVRKHNLEGQLFPATYNFIPTISTAELLATLTNQFQLNFDPITKKKNCRLTNNEILILASIVEKETADPQERRIIADIFRRRLEKKIPLESCATVIYALKQKEPNKKINHLTYKDTRIISPYNTYRHPGLPPAPICNPGLDSVNAVLNPEKNNYWYFFVSPSGSHIFSRTYKEHQQSQKRLKATSR